IQPRHIDELRKGEIAVFSRDDRVITHRVIAREGGRIVTQGDTVRVPDAPVTDRELLGVVVSISRAGKPRSVRSDRTVAGRLVAGLVSRSSRVSKALQRLASLKSAVVALEV